MGKNKTSPTSLPPTLLPVAHGEVTLNYASLNSVQFTLSCDFMSL